MRHLRAGIHDHHLAAARTDQERERIRNSPDHPDNLHYDDERCWVTYDDQPNQRATR